MRRLRVLLSFLALSVTGAAPLALHAPRVHAADDRTAQQGSAAPTLKVYSRETIVDITVTDKDGNPVHGLTRDDFAVKEDGKDQPIKSFAEFGASIPAQPLPKLPANTYTNLQPPAPSGATNILWLDFTNAAPVLSAECCILPLPSGDPTLGPKDLARSTGWQKHAKDYAELYVKQMPAGTRVAIFGTSYPDRLRVLQGITSDPALLSAAIDTMRYDTDGMVTKPSHEEWCAQQDRRNRMTLESLNQIAADLAQIKGRKNLLWYTARIRSLTDQHPDPCLAFLYPEVQKAYGLLAAAQVTVYPISVRGVEENSMEKAEDILGLETVAEATGGKAYYNSNDIAGLTAKAVNTGSDYYTLSYVPPGNEYDGRHHTIKVAADKPALKLTYRDEYYAEDPRTMVPTPGLSLAEAPDAAGPLDMRKEMSRAMPISTAFLFDVQVEPATAPAKPTDPQVIGVLATRLKDKPLTRYDVQYALPAKQIALTTLDNGLRHGSLEFDLAAYDGDGNVVTSWRQAIQLNLTAEQETQFVQSPFRYSEQLDLPAGALFLRIGILDRTSNKVGTLEIPLTVARPSPQRTAQK